MQPNTLAILILCGFALALAAWILVAIRRSPYTPLQSAIYLVNVLLTRVLWRTEIVGKFPLSADQGAVIVCNHGSPVDPFFIQLTTGRVVHWMVASEYCEMAIFRWFFKATQSIPTRRGGVDTASTKSAIRWSSDRGLVGMLPEGRINDTDEIMLSGRPGAALVALRSQVPIVPCYIRDAPYDGTFYGCLFMAAKVQLIVGDPIDISEYYGRHKDGNLQREITLRLLKEIARLGGAPDYEPTLAGRRWKPGSKQEESLPTLVS